MANILSWHIKAACDGTFDDRPFDSHLREQKAFIKEFCDGCVVRDLCLLDAIENDNPPGVWGGMTLAEREKLLRRSKNALGIVSVRTTQS
ncbi:WhiB family transcriptional regulator [Candidatus Saccharibacteria bacterium]|nr:WhiB family transcriptional regulator [Candidatus Saccharibacteria bacterium]MCB9817095.1 WhiB family transcriptional regulator [Candidatus Nomurabacteria bacterium]